MSIAVNSRYLPPNPCMGCRPPKRSPTCHASCPEYESFRRGCAEVRAKHTADNLKNSEAGTYRKSSIAKNRDRKVNTHHV